MQNILRVSFIVISGVLVTGLAQPGRSQEKPRFDAELHQADQLLGQSHFAAARKKLVALSYSRYADAHVYYALAESYYGPFDAPNKDLGIADSLLKRALQLDPESGIVYRQMSQVALRQDNPDRAILLANKALSVKKPDPSAIYHRGKAYAIKKEYRLALADINAWLHKIAPDGKWIPGVTDDDMLLKANVLEKLNRWDEAIAVYREILPLRTDMNEFNIVRCLTNEKKYDEAIAEVSKVIKKNPQDDQAFDVRASLKLTTHDLQGALADCNTALSLSPLTGYYRNRAKVYQALGKPDLAKQDLER